MGVLDALVLFMQLATKKARRFPVGDSDALGVLLSLILLQVF